MGEVECKGEGKIGLVVLFEGEEIGKRELEVGGGILGRGGWEMYREGCGEREEVKMGKGEGWKNCWKEGNLKGMCGMKRRGDGGMEEGSD
jgi:hypothetical protein